MSPEGGAFGRDLCAIDLGAVLLNDLLCRPPAGLLSFIQSLTQR